MSITGTSPDVVQSLEFLMSRFFSGTRLQSGPSLDKIQKNIENLITGKNEKFNKRNFEKRKFEKIRNFKN